MAGHVSFFRMRAKPGQAGAVVAHFEKWAREQRPEATGFLFSSVATGNDDPDAVMGAVHWDTTERYVANAERPGQDAWYQELLPLLDGEPEWFDGTVRAEVRAS